MNEWINEKLLPPVLKFVNTKAITALRNGMLYTMPFTIVGSVFLLLANFPVTAISEWVNASGLAVYFNQAYGASFAIMSLFAVIGIAYSYVKSEGFEGLPAGMIAMVVFILFMSSGSQRCGFWRSSWQCHQQRLDSWQRDDYSYYCWFVSRRCI